MQSQSIGLGAGMPLVVVAKPALGDEVWGGQRVPRLIKQDRQTLLLKGAKGPKDPVGAVLVVVQEGLVGVPAELERVGPFVPDEGLVEQLVGGLQGAHRIDVVQEASGYR